MQEIWNNTSKMFMKEKKILNVKFVAFMWPQINGFKAIWIAFIRNKYMTLEKKRPWK